METFSIDVPSKTVSFLVDGVNYFWSFSSVLMKRRMKKNQNWDLCSTKKNSGSIDKNTNRYETYEMKNDKETIKTCHT